MLPSLHSRGPTKQEIRTLVEKVATLPPVELPVKHHFSMGTYVREIHMPAGSVVVGKEHKTRHTNIVVSGKCTVWTAQGRMELVGPCTFESMAGVQKVLHMHTDVVWMTVHPTDETDLDRLEGMFIQSEQQIPLFPALDNLLLGDTV